MNSLTETQRKNCRILATQIMPAIPDDAFDMRAWVSPDRDISCGTTGCALGWAALSRQIPGLAWCAYRQGGGGYELSTEHALDPDKCARPWPVSLNPAGKWERRDWHSVGDEFFGAETRRTVFMRSHLNYMEVVDRLLILADGGTP